MRSEPLAWKKMAKKYKVSSHIMHISPITSSLVLLFRNEEKLVALLVHSTFRQLATTSSVIFPYSLVRAVKSGICAQMRSEYGLTPCSVQHCGTR